MVIGLDGGTWKVFDRILADGCMPTFQRFVEDGAAGVLESTIPPITPVAWTSFQTGCDPDKHGVLSFIAYSKKDRRMSFVNSSTVRVPTIWEIVSYFGRKVISINVPLTYPPKEINGYMVTGMLTPDDNCNYTYPTEFKKEVQQVVPNYPLVESNDIHRFFTGRDISSFVSLLSNVIAKKTELALHTLRTKDWDLFMLHFQALDTLQHPLWCFIDSTHEFFDEQKYQVVKRFYVNLDQCIQRITSEGLNDDAILFFISDHGFQTNRYFFYINNWLHKKGYLKLKQNYRTVVINRLFHWVRRIDRFRFRFLIIPDKMKMDLFNTELGIYDLDHSAVFAVNANPWGCLYFQSHLPANDIETLLRDLLSITNPETGERIVHAIHRKEDIYDRQYWDMVPDIVVAPQAGYSFSTWFNGKDLFQEAVFKSDYQVGTHDMEGIVVGYHDKYIKNSQIKAHIRDVPATVLHLMGLPIPTHMDGRLIEGMLTSGFKKEVEHVDLSLGRKDGAFTYSPSDEEAIQKALKDLGYF